MQRIPAMSEEQFQREQVREQSPCPEIWTLLDQVKDPEIPAISLWDLGVLSNIERDASDRITVTISPTYSGCPAMDVMREDIEAVLADNGFQQVAVKTQLSPPWTTDWMTAKGKAALKNYGIAPPADHEQPSITPESAVTCPHCESIETRRVSEFGSTACKALFQCDSCGEPFDYFKKI